jgi:hypothetical protein
MTKNSEAKESAAEIELHPDAWERFTEFVKRIAKAGPQHRSRKHDVSPNKPKRCQKPIKHANPIPAVAFASQLSAAHNVGARVSSRNF